MKPIFTHSCSATVLAMVLLLGAAPALGKTARQATADGGFVAEFEYRGDPFHPAIGSFTLKARDGSQCWSDGKFGQNACWIANDGLTVVGLKSSGDENLPGILTFFGSRGDAVRSLRVVNFCGGGFTADGSLFIAYSRTVGIAAYDRRGRVAWSVAPGSAWFHNRDGGWLAVVRSARLDLYHNGAAAGSIKLGGPVVNDVRFAEDGATIEITGPGQVRTYDLGTLRLLRSLEWPLPPRPAPAVAQKSGSVNWPLAPVDSTHAIGNGWGEYQNYSYTYPPDPSAAYFHPGIDVMAQDTSGVPVYAVAHGWIKAWLNTSGYYYWRFAIADSNATVSDSCDGWLYAHVDPSRPHAAVGDEVWPGDQIGYLVHWPVTGFDHCHFARIRDAGSVWGNAGADWVFQDNPQNWLTPSADTARPVIEPALAGSQFAYCRNNTSTYLPDLQEAIGWLRQQPEIELTAIAAIGFSLGGGLVARLTGDVDIVARIYDRCGRGIGYYPDWEKLNPYRIEYAVHGTGGSLPRTTSFLFSHFLAWDDVDRVSTAFKQDDSCTTYGDYDSRQYYYIVTNTNGDTTLEVSDTSGCWRTTDFPDGHYWVVVYASDQAGNTTADSQLVGVNNHAGVAQPADFSPVPARLRLEPTRPNPFAGVTTISYQLMHGGSVSLLVYNIQGQVVRALVDGSQTAGRHAIPWNGRNDQGQRLAPAVYFLRLSAGGNSLTTKLILVK